MQTEFKPKKYLVKTFGCQANVADSGTMAGILEALGFERTDTISNSDIFIVNTCSVRQKSEDKVYGIGKNFIKDGKSIKNSEKPFTIMAGCMVGSVTGDRQRYEFSELKKRTPWVDEYINPSQMVQIPKILERNNILNEWAVKKIGENTVPVQDTPGHAFVNISYGCDNFCTFCVVPYARGKEVSRSKEDILNEVIHLTKRGFKEITLCGQNVNSWGLNMVDKFEIRTGSNQKIPFADLLRKIHEIDGIEKINFISSNPFDFTKDLIDALTLPKVSNYLHMAVQSGNNNILEKMNRRHTVEDFTKLIREIRKVNPELELGTDIIVGFPGETRKQFMDTVKLFKKINFRVAYISIYSPRKGTPSEKFYKDDVPLKEKRRRHAYLTKVWQGSIKKV